MRHNQGYSSEMDTYLITSIRSSLLGAHAICNHSSFLAYSLGVKTPSNKKATMGNMAHKALELLARKKKAEQDGDNTFESDGCVYRPEDMTLDTVCQIGFDHYSSEGDFEAREVKEVKKLVNTAITMNEGQWNPAKRVVVEPERYFEIELPYSWAYYSYNTSLGRLEGRLKLRGTLDLVVEAENDTYELVDWKTGQRKDWATGETKTFKKLMYDKQLLLYYFAMRLLYPDRDSFVTIVYCRQGKNYGVENSGAFSLPYGDREFEGAKNIIRSSFEEFKSIRLPKMNIGSNCNWCGYNKLKHEQSGKTLCQHYRDELVTIGMEGLVRKLGLGHLEKYTGGGRDGG